MHSHLKLASYNVHRFVGRDRQHDPQKVLDVIKAMQADIVALQEVFADDSTGKKYLGQFADEHEYRLIFGPTLQRESGHHYGNAMLVQCDHEDVKLHDISHPRREPRGVIETIVNYGDEKWQVLATHLGLSTNERRRQVKRLLNLINLNEYNNTILMGDLNEWYTWGRPLRWLKSYFHIGHARATFPTRFPLFALDRIWVHPSERIHRAYVYKTRLSRIASDHLPIIVEIA